MTIRKFIVTLVLAAFVFPAQASEQERATVLLRNGERVSGVLEDVDNNTVFVRVSQHDQRRISVNDVALIDLVGGASGLPETELNVARGSQHLALLRGGNSWQGQFVDIRGGEAAATQPLTLIFRTTDGRDQQVPLDNVARIYFGNFPVATNVAEGAPVVLPGDLPPAGSLRVPGNTTWIATPYTVRRGDRLSFNATGRIQLSDNPNDVAGAAGALAQRHAPGSPLPQNLAGALIAKVGTSRPFAIGDNTAPIAMPADGQLYLGINDDEMGDNRGDFFVQITPLRRR